MKGIHNQLYHILHSNRGVTDHILKGIHNSSYHWPLAITGVTDHTLKKYTQQNVIAAQE
ncbi:hypothetical protein [Sphingobacterium sp. SGR-19]|uniref:hypothetical protein n=1 Tax=Sphingobacterium sp. SGR-19 TaxID=2710886 RepID=UPI0013EB8635|nr:hypothetical protein [Sphingobacterium sp. SGR-19]NGM66425.1 hypothetical protein [Sphingobacterium sp. SGR-19]